MKKQLNVFVSLIIFVGIYTFSSAQEITMIVAQGDKIIAQNSHFDLYLSLDNGVTWEEVSTGLPGSANRFSMSGNNIYASAQYKGVVMSADNGKTWTKINNGLPTDAFTSTLIATDRTLLVSLYKYGIFAWNETEEKWENKGKGLKDKRVFQFVSQGNNIYALGSSKGVFLSIDEGENWLPLKNGPIGEDVTDMAVYGSGFIAGPPLKVKINNEDKWSNINFNFKTDEYLYSLAGNSNTIFLGTSKSGLYISENNGANWKHAYRGLSGDMINSIAANQSSVYAATEDGLYKSDDNGESWSSVKFMTKEELAEAKAELVKEKAEAEAEKELKEAKEKAAAEKLAREEAEAILFFEKVHPETWEAFYNRGLAEFGYNNFEAALENMNKAIELKPDFPTAYVYRAYLYNQTGLYEKAIIDYNKADNLKPGSSGYLTALPYASTGKKEEAFAYLEGALSRKENKASISQIMNDKGLESLHSDSKWSTLKSKDWLTPYEKIIKQIDAELAKEDFSGALEFINKAIELDPTNPIAFDRRANFYANNADWDNCMKDMNESIRLDPDNTAYLTNRAYLHGMLKNYTEALSDYNKAIEIEPQLLIQGERAKIKEAINIKDPTIIDDYNTQLNSYYKDDLTAFMIGSNYFINNNMTEAIKYLSRAITLKPEAAYLSVRGRAYFAEKLLDKALSDFNKSIEIDPNNGEAFYYRGTVKGEQLEKEDACSDWKKAVSLGFEDINGYIESICTPKRLYTTASPSLPYVLYGTESDVSVAARPIKNDIAIEIINNSDKTVYVNITPYFECNGVKKSPTFRKKFVVPAHTLKSYEIDGAEMKIEGCSDNTTKGYIDSMSVN